MINFQQLVAIMKRLRNPVSGCPWDLKQDESSLKDYILEEAYELIDAIDSGNAEKIKEELGDVLLQVVFISQINREEGHFSIKDVIDSIIKKLIFRHPHVFGSLSVDSAEEVKINWSTLKQKEKKHNSIISEHQSMAALLNANKISNQVSSVGFDWQDPLSALEKVNEEIRELTDEIKADKSQDKIQEELGDLFFALANVSRLLHINPEIALHQANKKFSSRFHLLEDKVREKGLDIHDLSLQEMESLWQQVKIENKKTPTK